MILRNYTTMQGYNCILGNVYNMLHYVQMDIKEQDLFFWFSPFQGSKNMYCMFNVLYEEVEKSKWQGVVKQSIKDQKPILIQISPRILPYIKYDTSNLSMVHYINIIGIDINEKKLCVSDSYVPTLNPSIYTGWIDYERLENSVEACWRVKNNTIDQLLHECKEEEIANLTYYNIIRRLKEFLGIDNNNECTGIIQLQNLSDRLLFYIERQNYVETYQMLAGLRLNVINPLIYLQLALERTPQYQNIAKYIATFTEKYWESLNMKLLKFSIAHKHIDGKNIATLVEEAIRMEQDLLKSIVDILLVDKAVITEKLCYIDRILNNPKEVIRN